MSFLQFWAGPGLDSGFPSSAPLSLLSDMDIVLVSALLTFPLKRKPALVAQVWVSLPSSALELLGFLPQEPLYALSPEPQGVSAQW